MNNLYPLLTIAFVFFFTSITFGQDTEIFVSDGGNFDSPPWQILKFDENGENPEVFIDQNLGWPQDIVFLPGQDVVLISNLNTGRITKYDANTGAYLGNFATGLGGPTRMKIGPGDLLYVLQWQGNGRVKRYQLDGTFVDDFTSVGINQSIGLDWDADGNLYVSSFGNNSVRRFDPNGNSLGPFLGASDLQGPTNIWFNDAGELLVSNWNGNSVKRFDAAGNFIDDFIIGLSMSEGVGVLSNGNILIGNGGTRSVKMFDSNGNYIEDIIPSGTANLLLPNAITVRRTRSMSVSIDEVETTKHFIHPTIGTNFFLVVPVISTFESIEVYNQVGMLMEKKKVTESQIWDGQQYPAGFYFIRVQSKAGDFFTQKVMVKK